MLTQYTFYQQEQAKRPEAVILMHDFDSYYILGDKAKDVLPIIEEVLTHKDAGKMFCWIPTDYGYPSLSFGIHNLYVVLPALLRANYRVGISDFDFYRDTPEYKKHIEKVSAHWRKMKEKEEQKQRKQPVQLSLFDEWFQ